ncbi:MAG TPA: hypothetical protein VIG73_00215 [Cerasibacillus sp.]|uniref:hypothetical protein n=1 Tax=Cerasibacillus sp. TaxID=2498711 RepID=UPI002F3EE217
MGEREINLLYLAIFIGIVVLFTVTVSLLKKIPGMSYVFRVLRYLIPMTLYTILVLFTFGLSGAFSLGVLSFFSIDDTALLYKGVFFADQDHINQELFYFVVIYTIFSTAVFYFVILAPFIPEIVHDYYIGESVVVAVLTVIFFPFVIELILPNFELSFKGALVFGLVNIVITSLSKNYSRLGDEY